MRKNDQKFSAQLRMLQGLNGKFSSIVEGFRNFSIENPSHRFWAFMGFALLGIFLLLAVYCNPVIEFFKCIFPEALVSQLSKGYLTSAISFLILTFPVVSFNWYLKNKDTLQTARFSENQLETQQIKNHLVNSQTLLFQKDSPVANALGLTQLAYLRRKVVKKIGLSAGIDHAYIETRAIIDSCTSGGLKLNDLHLVFADLSGADLRLANFKSSDLKYSICIGADFRDAVFDRAELYGANLENADFRAAKLINADLGDANLRGANFYNSDLKNSNLEGADVKGANFGRAENLAENQIMQAENWKEAELPDYLQHLF